jgi:hypothetical protein
MRSAVRAGRKRVIFVHIPFARAADRNEIMAHKVLAVDSVARV